MWDLGENEPAAIRPKAKRKPHIQRIPESWNMGLGGLVLGSLILYLKGMRILMFQLSGIYYNLP